MWGFVLCCFGSLIPVAMVDALSRRASFLWLKPGLDRAELFRLVERGSWRRLLVGNITAFLLAGPLVIYGTRFQHPGMILFAILAAPVAAGAALLYVWLLQVRGTVWGGTLTMITAGLLLLLQILFGSAAFVSGCCPGWSGARFFWCRCCATSRDAAGNASTGSSISRYG
jgi:hypothetical protein